MRILGPPLRVLVVAWMRRVYQALRCGSAQAFLESEQRLRILSDAVQGYAIFRLDPDGTVVSWEGGAERLKGYTARQIIGQHYSRFYVQNDIDQGAPAAHLRMAAATGRWEVQHWRVRRDGSQFRAIVVLTAIRDGSGALAGFYEVSRQITAHEQTAEMYRGLLDAAPDAMVVVDGGGVIVLLNAQAERQFGYLRHELVGLRIANLIPEGFEERLVADAKRTVADAVAQQIDTGLELTGRRKNGTEFPIEIMLSPLESPGGTLITAAVRDATARKKAEEHLMTTVAALKVSNDELAQFAQVASHDLQEPLRMVASYTQLLAKRYRGRLDADADEFIAYAVDGCTRMQRLIQDLLAYSRAGVHDAPLHTIMSETALTEALDNLRATIDESRAVVTYDPLPALATDQTLLAQVFQNLVGNAIKYRSEDAPRVHVSATHNDGAEWVFSVRDNGLGIDPQYFERIFVIFQRLHGPTEFQGTGIGLAICRKMIARLGGRIWVESQLTKGSTFHFALPDGAAA